MLRPVALPLICVVCLHTLLVAAQPERPASADAPERSVDADRQRFQAELIGLLGQLDSDDYTTRRHAAERVDALVAMPEHGRVLAAEFERALREPGLSFEVQWRLKRWLRRLPKLPPEPPGSAQAEELDRLVRQLDADAYAVRLAAFRRLEWLLGNGKMVSPITSRVKARLAFADSGAAGRKYLAEVWERLRPIWSQSDPADWNLPDVPDEVLADWVEAIAGAPQGDLALLRAQAVVAERELRDLLMRDAYVPRVAAALKAGLERPISPEGREHLLTLLEESQPAMVAEYWQDRRHLVEQHLLVDVPSRSVGAPRPSHFDRIDDRIAHCVCGSSLSPGEYPVGIAIPHPRTTDAFFHLVNLPTPRRRLWYQHYVATDAAKRLQQLSRRTVDWLRDQRRPLTEDDLRMLPGLDPGEVSRFAGWYFTAIDDSPLPPWTEHNDPYEPGKTIPLAPPDYVGGRPSRHGALCLLLAAEGTRAALPGLFAAIEQGRFQPPSENAPYHLGWIAALAIAQRQTHANREQPDPSQQRSEELRQPETASPPSLDAWLAGTVTCDQKLRLGDDAGGEVGATAAAILLARHGQGIAHFSLQPVEDEPLATLVFQGYRFTAPSDRRRVLQWYKETSPTPHTAP